MSTSSIENVENLKNLKMSLVKPVSKRLTYILLQQSPVQTNSQLERLVNIEETWAIWLKSITSCIEETKIIAALPHENFLSDKENLKSIGYLKMLPTESNGIEVTAFHQLVQSFWRILNNPSHPSDETGKMLNGEVQWMVFGNDHTYFLLPNLSQFLHSLSADSLIYTGNELAINFKKEKKLHFASGGAGAVLSHPAVKLQLIVWVLLSSLPFKSKNAIDPIIKSFLDENHIAINWNDFEPIYLGNGADDSYIIEKDNMLNVDISSSGFLLFSVVKSLLNWILSNNLIQKFRIVLSKKVFITFIKNPRESNEVSEHWNFSVQLETENETENETNAVKVRTVSSKQLLDDCLPSGTWAHANPGIILAYCLGHTFGVKLTPSTSPHIYEGTGLKESSGLIGDNIQGERFNVFSPLAMLTNDLQSWYINAKQLTTSQEDTKNPKKWSILAKNPISFHYINPAEAKLIFQLQLELQPHTWSSFGAISERSNFNLHRRSIADAYALQRNWPRKSEELSPYSRPLKGFQEAVLLFQYLGEEVKIAHVAGGCHR